MPEPSLISGFAAIADRYDGFILDQWGVLHEGSAPYPGSLETLAQLKRCGKRIAILTNSGKRADANAAVFRQMGFSDGTFDAIVSSGEETRHHLEARTDPWYQTLGRSCLFFSRGGDRHILDGLDLETVDDAARADFVLNTGVDADSRPITDYFAMLAPAAIRKIPMICANPDRVAPRGDRLVYGAGAVAEHYEKLGCTVRYHGKPYPSVFETAVAALGITDRTRILMVGDSLHHDILGAARAGLDSALIAGGVHASVLNIKRGEMPDKEAVTSLLEREKLFPTLTMPAFTW